MDIIKDITEIGGGILHAPSWLLLIIGLNLLGVFLSKTPVWPNAWNGLIGYVLLGLGMILAPLIIPHNIFPPEQPHPTVLLVIIGGIFGMVAWLLHGQLFQRLLDRYAPSTADANKNQK